MKYRNALLMVGMALVISCGGKKSGPFQDYWVPLPEVVVTLHTGETLPLSQVLQGHWTLIGWIYTHCPDVCPVITQHFRLMRDSLRALGYGPGQIRFLLISFDPERDTLGKLQEYAGHFDADEMLGFARTAPAATRRLASALGFSYRKLFPEERSGMGGMRHEGHQGYYFAHDVKSFLVAPDGSVVGVYQGDMAEPAPPRILIPGLLRRMRG